MSLSVEQIIAERTYGSLSPEEKSMVSELCANEQEFLQMKQFFAGMTGAVAASRFEAPVSVKQSLDSVFAAKHGGIGAKVTPREPVAVPAAAKVIPLYRKNWARIAAAVILIAGVASVWKITGSPIKEEKKSELAMTERPALQSMDESASEPVRAKDLTAVPAGNAVPRAITPGEDNPEPVLMKQAEAEAEYFAADAVFGAVKSFSANAMKDSYAADTLSARKDYLLAASKKSITSQGKNADLYPNGYMGNAAVSTSYSVAESKEDLLSYIVPAF